MLFIGNDSSFPCNITYWAISCLPVSLLQGRKRRKSKEKGGRRDKYLQLQKEGGKANREEKIQQKQSRNIIPDHLRNQRLKFIGAIWPFAPRSVPAHQSDNRARIFRKNLLYSIISCFSNWHFLRYKIPLRGYLLFCLSNNCRNR